MGLANRFDDVLRVQGRTQDLLLQNRELVDHIDILVSRLSELEVSRGAMDTCGVQRLMRVSNILSIYSF